MKDIGDLTFRAGYWADPVARGAFKEFLTAVHGLDLTLWEQKGFWDEHYAPFSFFDQGRVVSSVCVYSMEMTIAGRPCRVGQLSGVGTLPPYRRRGLARWLALEALRRTAAEHEGYYLFADDEALPLYRQCGFTAVTETGVALVARPPRPRPGLRQLDTRSDRDLDLVYRCARDRSPVSDRIGVHNPKLLMFHCLYGLRDHAYHIPDLDAVVFFKTGNGRLDLFDVVARRVPPFAELHPFLAHDGLRDAPREVRFHFMTDKMGIAPTGRWTPPGNNTHIRPPLALPGPAGIFPMSAHA